METTKQATKMVDDENLKVGDIIKVGGYMRMVTEIRPYVGPLSDLVFAVAYLDRGTGISLTKGGQSEILERR